MKAFRNIIAWVLAVIITIAAAVYQRTTGPTYPKKEKITIDNTEYKFKLIRSHGGEKDAIVELENISSDISGELIFRRYPTKEEWTKVDMQYKDSILIGELPKQPPAGKLEYYINLKHKDKIYEIGKDEKIIIRFKGAVPKWVLLPHVLFMFIAMLLSNLSGLLAIFKIKKQKFYSILTLILLFIGGMILGPIMQKYAFGEFWTGVPFGWDLTDNKTLIAFVAWIAAVVLNQKKQMNSATIAASVITLLIYSIPHSMFGSELDPNTGEVIQAYIVNYFYIF